MNNKPTNQQLTTAETLDYIQQQTGRNIGNTNIAKVLGRAGIEPVKRGRKVGNTCYYDIREIDTWCQEANIKPIGGYTAFVILRDVERKGLDMRDLAERIGCHESTLSNIKRVTRTMSNEMYVKIQNVLAELESVE